MLLQASTQTSCVQKHKNLRSQMRLFLLCNDRPRSIAIIDRIIFDKLAKKSMEAFIHLSMLLSVIELNGWLKRAFLVKTFYLCEVSISMIHSVVGSNNLNKICLNENYLKSNKRAITACKFSKIFRGSLPPDPPRAFLVSQVASNLFCRKKKYT